MWKIYLIFSLIYICLFSCKELEQELPVYNFGEAGIFVCNEGNFTYGNSSLSYIDLSENKIYNNVFYEANGYPLGDVAQSITIYGDNAYISVNNSAKIYVVDKNTFKISAEINNLTSPRYICFIDSTKAYISDLYSPFISVFNPQNNSVSGSVNLGCSSEQMLLYENYIYVASWAFNNKIFKIDAFTDEIIDSLTIGYQPNSLVVDANKKLWVLSDGGNIGSDYLEIPSLTKISVENFEIDTTLFFKNSELSPSHLCKNFTGDTIYFISDGWGKYSNNSSGVFKMSVNDIIIPDIPLISENENSFYSLFINPLNSDIYVSDALSFTENGLIYRYSGNGKLISSFEAGIIPGNFTFKGK